MISRVLFPRLAARTTTLLTGLGLLLGVSARAQAPSWQHVTAVGEMQAGLPMNAAEVLAAATDANGNVYLAGYFNGAMTVGTTSVTPVGAADGFVAKWNAATQRFAWVQRFGGAYSDQLNSVAVRGNSVYVAGFFSQAPLTAGAVTLPNAGGADAFVAKIVDAGPTSSVAWMQSFGGAGTDEAKSVAVEGSNVYLSGHFSGSATFGSSTLTSTARTDLFVAKLVDAGSTGSLAWVQSAAGEQVGRGQALAVSGSSVYVAGRYAGPQATFGSTTLANAGTVTSYDGFVAKLIDAGSSGSFTWALPLSGVGDDQWYSLAASGSSIYAIGSAGRPTLAGTPISGLSRNDALVAKFTDAGTSGALVWTQQATNASTLYGNGISVAGSTLLISGAMMGSTASFGATTLTNASSTNTDAYVAKLLDAGPTASFVWAERAGGPNNDYSSAVVVGNGMVYVAGTVQPPASFGGFSFPNAASATGFVAALPDQALATAAPGWARGLTLHPNPARAGATVCLAGLATPVTLTLLDALGRVVGTQSAGAAAEAVSLPLPNLAPGLYHLRVQARGRSTHRALLVE